MCVDASFWEDLRSLWGLTLGHPSVKIAVLDTRVDLSHEAFEGRSFSVFGDAPGGSGSSVAGLHGTAVSSIIFGRHSARQKGIAPDCQGLILPVYDEGNAGQEVRTTQERLATAILTALEKGAKIINVSGGELVAEPSGSEFLEGAIKSCVSQGSLVIAAAGNDACKCLHVPAALPGVLAVGAMDECGAPLEFSNWGEEYQINGILAPGKNIIGAVPGNGYKAFTGTSYAAPLVAGAAALLASLQAQRDGRIDMPSIHRALLSTCVPCGPADKDCAKILAGRINIAGAMKALFGGVPSNFITSKVNVSNAERYNYYPMNTTKESTPTNVSESLPGATGPLQSEPRTTVGDIAPSDCGCGCGGKTNGGGTSQAAPQLVFALGSLDYDFGTQARRDTFIQQSDKRKLKPEERGSMIEFLKQNPKWAAALNWVLKIDDTPIYVLRPSGAYADSAYERFVALLEKEESLVRMADDECAIDQRISVSGHLIGSPRVRLFSGESVDVVVPDIRGLFAWETEELVKEIVGKKPSASNQIAAYEEKANEIWNFLSRIYNELRNLGITGRERAINYAGYNASPVGEIFVEILKKGLVLGKIDAVKSPLCRQFSDCWDVTMSFFDPGDRLKVATLIYQYTIDVSDVIPVSVGCPRHWYAY